MRDGQKIFDADTHFHSSVESLEPFLSPSLREMKSELQSCFESCLPALKDYLKHFDPQLERLKIDVQEWLKEITGRKIYLTAPTHVAARNLRVEGLEPMTLCRFWNRHLKPGAGLHKDCTVVIDEVSQVSTLSPASAR